MALPGAERIWLWIGTIGMLLGMLYFVGRGWDVEDEDAQEYYIITIFVAATAFTAYLSMATGYGVIHLPFKRQPVYWARYADWLITTPLLLVDLALLADAGRNTIATLVGLDVAMVLTGAVATLTTEGVLGLGVDGTRLLWWGVSTGYFLALLYLLLGRLSEQADRRGGRAADVFRTLRTLTAVLWTLYPVVWLVGPSGLGVIGLFAETAAFMVLDLAAKIGFGALLLQSREAIGASPTAAE
ncbi:MAG: bacteriorhodopsin [Halobacteriaceae archaeon]